VGHAGWREVPGGGSSGPGNGCGENQLTERSYEHRRELITDRIKQLAGIFAIDVAGYAALSNHAYVVARIDRERALGCSMQEAVERWTALFTGPQLVTRYLSRERDAMLQAEIDTVVELAEINRQRLYDLSWFMRSLNEHIAGKANAEDGVKGRF